MPVTEVLPPSVVVTVAPFRTVTAFRLPVAAAALALSVTPPLPAVRFAAMSMGPGASMEMAAEPPPALMACETVTLSTSVLARPCESVNVVPPWNVIDWAVLLPLAESVILLTLATEKDVVPVMSPPSV